MPRKINYFFLRNSKGLHQMLIGILSLLDKFKSQHQLKEHLKMMETPNCNRLLDIDKLVNINGNRVFLKIKLLIKTLILECNLNKRLS